MYRNIENFISKSDKCLDFLGNPKKLEDLLRNYRISIEFGKNALFFQKINGNP